MKTREIKQYVKVSNDKISTYQNGGIHLKQCLKEILALNALMLKKNI